MRKPERIACFFHIILGPLDGKDFWGVDCKKFLQVFGERDSFPRGVSRVVTVVHDQIGKGGSSFFVHAALKIRGDIKGRLVRLKLEDSLRKHFPKVFPPAIPPEPDPIPLEVKGIAGWDRLCRRLLAEGLIPIPQTVAWSVLPEDMGEFRKCIETFERAGGPPYAGGGRTRRPLRTYRKSTSKRGKNPKRGPL